MESSIDLYSEEFADDYADENHEDNEQEQENQEIIEVENDNEAGGDAEDDKNEDEEKKKIKPKRVIKNPRPKLNVASLKSRKGLLCLENYFKDKKYKGRGHEEEDLRTIMKTYEYWCHRLFPKVTFDECLEKIEKLGTKKETQTYLKRIRMDLIFDEEQPIIDDDENDDNPNQETQQSNNAFDELRSEQSDNQISTLTEEQSERIRINREKANQLRLERLQKAKEKAQNAISQNVTDELSESNVIDDIVCNEKSGGVVAVFEENLGEKSDVLMDVVANISVAESNARTSQEMEKDDDAEIPTT